MSTAHKALILLLVGFCMGCSVTMFKARKIISIEFEYSALDEYYLECRSLHGGAGRVTVRDDGTYTLQCTDGHMAGEPRHKITTGNPLTRASNHL